MQKGESLVNIKLHYVTYLSHLDDILVINWPFNVIFLIYCNNSVIYGLEGNDNRGKVRTWDRS